MYIMYIALAGGVACHICHRDFPALVKHGTGIGMAYIHPVQCRNVRLHLTQA